MNDDPFRRFWRYLTRLESLPDTTEHLASVDARLDIVENKQSDIGTRLARLERLAAEVDVITHTDHPEDRPWNER
jgi:uncharacterized membrane protein